MANLFSLPRGALRYRGAYGGRGSGKSYSFAKMALLWGAEESLRILCTREFQASIRQSFFAELASVIEKDPLLQELYEVGETFIRGTNGTEFLFKGLRHGAASIASTAQIDLCIVEEAEDIPLHAWNKLIPTIRAPKSEIWVIWNPAQEGSPTDTLFRRQTPPRSRFIEHNYNDNPWFPSVLEEERLSALENLDPGMYNHIWEGAYLSVSSSQILADKLQIGTVETQALHGPYLGLDFGFSSSPNAAVLAYVGPDFIYVAKEAGGTRQELDELPSILLEAIPEAADHIVRADDAEPKSISYLNHHGLPKVIAAGKWSGISQDAIKYLRSFSRIIVHPDCKETIKEMKLYSYKVDRLSGDPLPVIVSKYDHYIDALTYALAPMIKRGTTKSLTHSTPISTSISRRPSRPVFR